MSYCCIVSSFLARFVISLNDKLWLLSFFFDSLIPFAICYVSRLLSSIYINGPI
ncbi:hypothetical protein BCR44DRAFT_1427135 [Catenaria anguillulae PL171]|uniref:Uncharacterized protein n=1 Tax=Catenaria anguillulae PL171 TaxID=765915 RepID=A0A1Y2HWX7_9FUNG|nr:hypothetical protein BCR44DRAFT_1427135 [Catenaria anguillulae PL171]